MGQPELDVFQAHVLQPAIGMPVNAARPFSSRDHVANDDIADGSSGWLILPRCSIHLATALDVEVDRIAVSPPEPAMARAFDCEVREHHIAHITSVENHESQAAVRVGDHGIVDGHFAYAIAVAVTEFYRARS